MELVYAADPSGLGAIITIGIVVYMVLSAGTSDAVFSSKSVPKSDAPQPGER